nr:hypothetical protein CFP56_03185 [Quercus suber]
MATYYTGMVNNRKKTFFQIQYHRSHLRYFAVLVTVLRKALTITLPYLGPFNFKEVELECTRTSSNLLLGDRDHTVPRTGRQKVSLDLSIREAHSCIVMDVELYTASVVTTASIPLLQRPLVTKRSVG